MHIIGPPPQLTPRAAEQINALGVAVAIGFNRLRAIGRSRRSAHERVTQLRGDKQRLENEQTLRAPYPSERERSLEIAKEILETQGRIHSGETTLKRFDDEEESILSWHNPAGRLLDAILKELGFTAIEQVLPDFDDGSGELQDIRRTVEQAANAAFSVASGRSPDFTTGRAR